MSDMTDFNNETRADQIRKAFKEFHAANPEVWILFQEFTFKSISAGRAHYSCNAIFERIRWHVDIDTRGDAAKLNNNFRPYYARMFIAKNPEYADFFRNRRLVSAAQSPHGIDIQFWPGQPPAGEEALMNELRRL